MPKAADFKPRHFKWEVQGKVATVTLNRPERKNPLTFESYAELRDTFRALNDVDDVKTVVVTGAGGNFCSGGDVHEIIGPLTKMKMPGLLEFTRMTGDLVKAMRGCPQPIIAAVDGVCATTPGAMAAASVAQRSSRAHPHVAGWQATWRRLMEGFYLSASTALMTGSRGISPSIWSTPGSSGLVATAEDPERASVTVSRQIGRAHV